MKNHPSERYHLEEYITKKHFETNRFRELTLDEKRELKLEDLGI